MKIGKQKKIVNGKKQIKVTQVHILISCIMKPTMHANVIKKLFFQFLNKKSNLFYHKIEMSWKPIILPSRLKGCRSSINMTTKNMIMDCMTPL